VDLQAGRADLPVARAVPAVDLRVAHKVDLRVAHKVVPVVCPRRVAARVVRRAAPMVALAASPVRHCPRVRFRLVAVVAPGQVQAARADRPKPVGKPAVVLRQARQVVVRQVGAAVGQPGLVALVARL
jgi:hypothetical protein